MGRFNHNRFRRNADRLIDKYGKTVTLKRDVASGDDENPTLTTTTYTAVATVTKYTNNEIDGTLIQANDRKIIMKAGGLAIVPNEQDRVVVDDEGRDHAIVNVERWNPGGVDLFYEIQARS